MEISGFFEKISYFYFFMITYTSCNDKPFSNYSTWMTELEQQLIEGNKALFTKNQSLAEKFRQLTVQSQYMNKKRFESSSEKTKVADAQILLF